MAETLEVNLTLDSPALNANTSAGNPTLVGDINNVVVAGVVDVWQNGESVLENGIAKVVVPTKTSDLTNDSGFITTTYHDPSKQNVIGDLDAIRSGASAGATALQPSALIGYVKEEDLGMVAFTNDYDDLENKPTKLSDFTNDVGYITNSYHDASKQDILSTTQLEAVNSGINSSKVSEITLNTNARHTHSNKTYLDTINGAWSSKQNVINDSNKLPYNLISGTPDLSGYITKDVNNLTNYTTTTDLNTALSGKQDKIDSSHKLDYSLVANTPTKLSDFDNDEGFIDNTYHDSSKEDVANKKTAIDSSDTYYPTNNAVRVFVNNSIASATANFKGTLDVVNDLHLQYGATTSAIATALDSHTFSPVATPNDYCFVVNKDTHSNTIYQRFKFTGTNWLFEYELNNSSFTTAQWNAINSGATTTNIGQITTNANAISGIKNGSTINSFSGVESALSGKQATLDATQLNAVNSGINSTKVGNYDSHLSNTSNPHSVTKAQVGLGNVENKSSATIRSEITSSNVTTALGYTPLQAGDISGKLDKSGGTMTGNLTVGSSSIGTNGYIEGTWLKTSSTTDLSTYTDFFVNSNGWLYKRSKTNVMSDLGISAKENSSNKVTSISSASTDTQYPSAKCVYDIIGNIEATLDAIRGA